MNKNRVNIHKPFVNALVRINDWCALIRYWVVHQYIPALQQAIIILQHKSVKGPQYWIQVYHFVNSLLLRSSKQCCTLSQHIVNSLDYKEANILFQASLIRKTALIDKSCFAPIDFHNNALNIGIEAAKQGVELAGWLSDSSCLAYFRELLGQGYNRLNQTALAVSNYKDALSLWRKLTNDCSILYRPYVARVLVNLGGIQSTMGDFLAAQTCFIEALSICREVESEHPGSCRDTLVITLYNLGTIHIDLHNYLDADNYLTEAATLCSKGGHTATVVNRVYLANIQNSLAVLLHAKHEFSNSRMLLQKAIIISKRLRNDYSYNSDPELAMSMHNMGNIEYDLGEFDLAIQHLQEALLIKRKLSGQQPTVYRPDLASTLNNLGVALGLLIGNENARVYYTEAVTIYRECVAIQRDAYLPLLAHVLRNLGNVEQELGELESARAALQEALEIHKYLVRNDSERFNVDLALSLINMGALQNELGDLIGARSSLQQALEMIQAMNKDQPICFRAMLATTLNNLGTVLIDMGDKENACRNLEHALELRRNLFYEHPDVFRLSIASTLNNLGFGYEQLNRNDEAIACFQEAANILEIDNDRPINKHPFINMFIWSNLGRLHYNRSEGKKKSDLTMACQALRKATECAESFRIGFRGDKARQRILKKAVNSYILLVESCINVSELNREHTPLREAIEVSETLRARHLSDLLSDEALLPSNTPKKILKQYSNNRKNLYVAQRLMDQEDRRSTCATQLLVPKYEDSNDKRQLPTGFINNQRGNIIRLLDQSLRVPGRLDYLRKHILHLQETNDRLVKNIQETYDSFFNPNQHLPPIAFETIEKLIPVDIPTAFVQYNCSSTTGNAIVLTTGKLRSVRMPDYIDSDAFVLAKSWFETFPDLTRCRSIENGDPLLFKKKDKADSHLFPALESARSKILESVAQRTVVPVLDKLVSMGIRRLVVSPSRWLHIFPLHACRLSDGRYLIEHMEIVYTPSFSILHRCIRRKSIKSDKMLLIQNPSGNLLFSELEGTLLKKRYRNSVVLNATTANKQRVLRCAKGSQIFHYCGHIKYDAEDPLKSALILQSNSDSMEWLTLRDVFLGLDLQGNAVTVLNGCDSGLLQPEMTDEYLNLPAGFLYAGARCVISTLWPVDDLSSSLLMERFYKEMQNGKAPAAALREAQRWIREDIKNGPHLMERILPPLLQNLSDPQLRMNCFREAHRHAVQFPEQPPFQSPSYWAPFICTGAGY